MKKSIQALFTISALAAGALFNSCDSFIFDGEGDCSVHYRVPITYTMNAVDANAFQSQVKSVTLYVYDSQGNLVLRKTDSGSALAKPDYAMDIELKPGSYSMLVWGEGSAQSEKPTSFAIGGGDNPALTSLSATLPLNGTTGNLYSDRDITPLYHGYISNVELQGESYGTITLPAIDLTKDTNIFTIALENIEGTPIEPDALTVKIEADNSELNWQNQLIGNKPFSYLPWSITQISSERPSARASENQVTGLLTELTTGRLILDRKPMLVVHRNTDDKEVLRLDLINLLMLVKGHYPWGGQQYLDRLDRFTMTFFVDADLNWYTANGINILGWNVVPPHDIEI